MKVNKPVFKERGCVSFPEQFKDKFGGYLGEKGNGVFISFIISRYPRKGNFSRLLNYLKKKYAWIKIPTPSNTLRAICLKKGFKETTEFFPPPFNETGEILLWKK